MDKVHGGLHCIWIRKPVTGVQPASAAVEVPREVRGIGQAEGPHGDYLSLRGSREGDDWWWDSGSGDVGGDVGRRWYR